MKPCEKPIRQTTSLKPETFSRSLSPNMRLFATLQTPRPRLTTRTHFSQQTYTHFYLRASFGNMDEASELQGVWNFSEYVELQDSSFLLEPCDGIGCLTARA